MIKVLAFLAIVAEPIIKGINNSNNQFTCRHKHKTIDCVICNPDNAFRAQKAFYAKELKELNNEN